MGVVGMSPEIVLEFEGGYLRPLKPEDMHPGYVSGLNDAEVNRYLDGVKHTKQTTQSVIDFVTASGVSTNSVLWGIWQENSKNHCGTVRLHGIEYHHKTAHIGVCLFDKSAWGKRLGLKAVVAVTQWAFDTLRLRWVEAGVYSENNASQKAFLAAAYEWIYDIPDKYILEGRPTRVKVYAARNAKPAAPQSINTKEPG
jgi:RimJ/RimL family protein N-acetyltransferase